MIAIDRKLLEDLLAEFRHAKQSVAAANVLGTMPENVLEAQATMKLDYLIQRINAALSEPQGETPETVFLLDGTRFKLSFSGNGNVSCFGNYRNDLEGQWVALVASDNDKHLEIERRLHAAEKDARRWRKARSRGFGIADWTEFAKPLIRYEDSADKRIDAEIDK